MATLRETQWALQAKIEEINQRDFLIDELEDELDNRAKTVHSLRKELTRYRGIVSKLTSVNNALRKSAAAKSECSNDAVIAPLIKAYDSTYSGSTKVRRTQGSENRRSSNIKSVLDGKHKAAEVISAAMAIQNNSEDFRSVDGFHRHIQTPPDKSRSSSDRVTTLNDAVTMSTSAGTSSATSIPLDSSRRAILANAASMDASSSSTSSSIRSLTDATNSLNVSAHLADRKVPVEVVRHAFTDDKREKQHLETFQQNNHEKSKQNKTKLIGFNRKI